MKKIICTFISIAVLSILAGVSASAQTYGTRVEADIPFDFTVGKKTYKAGSYDLSIVRGQAGTYLVSLFDENGKYICRSFAVENAGTVKRQSILEFSVMSGEHYLAALRTPDVAYSFLNSPRNKSVAQAERVSVPLSGPQ